MKTREVGACSLFPDPAVQLQTQTWPAFSLQTRFSSIRGKVNPEHRFSPRFSPRALQVLQYLEALGLGLGVAVAWAKGEEASVVRTFVP